jgi:DNA-binding beta-propeller fold protein YncE
MITDPTGVDQILRSAYADAAATIQPDDLQAEAPPPVRPARREGAAANWSRRAIPLAAAAAVVAVVVTAGLVQAALRPGPRPTSGAASGPMAYAATGQDTVIPISLASGTALAPIRLGVVGYPAGLAISPDGRTIYEATSSGAVTPVDVATRHAGRPIRVGGFPLAMVMSPDGRIGYVLESSSGVAVVNFVTGQKMTFIKVSGAAEFAITPNGRTVYVANSEGSAVTPIDTATDTAGSPIRTAVNAGPPVITIAPDGKTAYILGGRRGGPVVTSVITPISTAANVAGRPIDLGKVAVQAMTISPDSRTAYVWSGNGAIRIDLVSGTARQTITLPGTPYGYRIAISPDGRTVYALRGRSNMLYRISAATGGVPLPIRLSSAQWLADADVFGPGGKTLYVLSDPADGTARYAPSIITPVNVAKGTVGNAIRLPSVAIDIAFSR